MTPKVKKHFIRTLFGTLLFIITFVLNIVFEDGIYTLFSLGQFKITVVFALFVINYFAIGGDIVVRAIKNVLNLQMLDENFLMFLATIGAFFVGDYAEGVAVMVFFQIGEFFQEYAVSKARKSIKELMEIVPDEANVIRNGVEECVDPDEVEVGEIIVIRPGEKIPLDGVVRKGNSSIDTKALTGESMPRMVGEDEEVISGCINIDGVIEVEVLKAYEDSTVTKILELVENASSRKGQSEKFITKFARYYTPIVVALSLMLAIIPPIVIGACQGSIHLAVFKTFIYRALTFLVISCPCALVISIPLSFFGGIGAASKNGILIKGSNYLENLARTELVVMDKTGTLTKGIFEVTKVEALNEKYTSDEILGLLVALEEFSNHPIALSIKRAGQNLANIKQYSLRDVHELSGFGISGRLDDTILHAGNSKLLLEKNIPISDAMNDGTVVYLANEKQCIGYAILADEIKENADQLVKQLKNLGVKETVILSGDRRDVAKKVGCKLGFDRVYYELLPDDKVIKLEEIDSIKSENGILIYVGDGINDAPVLARADIGIAMGGLGSDAAIEAADIVIMDDELLKIETAIKIALRTIVIVKENIVFAIGVKVLILILAALGMVGMWWAIFADVGVAVIAILNAMRTLVQRFRD